MKIIFAQGNPGDKYARTRHNTGFYLLDTYASKHNVEWVEKKKFNSLIAEFQDDDEKVLLVKPLTFYNDTGLAARQLTDFYNLNPADSLLVIHDDLALPLGTIRTRKQGSDAGNNGIKSINQHVGQDYHRIRIGIWNDLHDRMGDLSFVIGPFTKADVDVLDSIQPDVNKYIDNFIHGTLVHETKKLQTE